MTPQPIKLTAHDGSGVCPIRPLKDWEVLVTRYKVSTLTWLSDEKPHERCTWGKVLSYAVITLVEPDPVIEVGDRVYCQSAGMQAVVISLHETVAWVLYDLHEHPLNSALRYLTFVRKGDRS